VAGQHAVDEHALVLELAKIVDRGRHEDLHVERSGRADDVAHELGGLEVIATYTRGRAPARNRSTRSGIGTASLA
jgi:hypothetical protein